MRGNSQARLTVHMARRLCLECCNGSRKSVTYCPCDGLHSTRCELWPFRFGMIPATAAKRYGPAVVDPKRMPDADTDLDKLPPNPRWLSKQDAPSDPSERKTS